jgi:hypothetical protein
VSRWLGAAACRGRPGRAGGRGEVRRALRPAGRLSAPWPCQQRHLPSIITTAAAATPHRHTPPTCTSRLSQPRVKDSISVPGESCWCDWLQRACALRSALLRAAEGAGGGRTSEGAPGARERRRRRPGPGQGRPVGAGADRPAPHLYLSLAVTHDA